MTPVEFYETVLVPGLNKIQRFAPQMPRSRALDVLMTAISGEEADWTERVQIGSGMAHGLFQMQLNTIELLMKNPASAKIFVAGMDDFGINTRTAEHLFEILRERRGDILAVFLARLDLWCNPKPIPFHDEEQALFEYYAETWRPRHANRRRWAEVYPQALAAVPE